MASSLSDLVLDQGRSHRRSSEQDESIEALMRVSDDPLLLRELMVRHGKGAPHVLPQHRINGPLMCQQEGWRTSGQTRHGRPYGAVEPLQGASFRPEVFEPRDEDISQSVVVSKVVTVAPIAVHGGLAVLLAAIGVLAFVGLWLFS